MKSYNEQIVEVLQRYISQSKKSIWLNVPWFTHRELFEALCEQAKKGVSIKIILQEDDINRGASFSQESIRVWGGEVYWFKGANDKQILHEKYCIIDEEVIIYGSFNWTYNAAQNNLESILVAQKPTSSELVETFIRRFEEVLQKYFQVSVSTTNGGALYAYGAVLKMQIALLESECAYLEAQIQEIEAGLHSIEAYVQLHLGELIMRKLYLQQEIARYKAQKYRKKIYEEDYKQEKETYQNFQKLYEYFQRQATQIKESVQKPIEKSFKELYRKLAKILHPDRYLNTPHYEQVTRLMAKLNEAYAKRDWQLLQEIEQKINNSLFTAEWQTENSQEKLEKQLLFWQNKKNQLLEKIQNLQKAEFYPIFTGEVDLEVFVLEKKNFLERDISILEQELKNYQQ